MQNEEFTWAAFQLDEPWKRSVFSQDEQQSLASFHIAPLLPLQPKVSLDLDTEALSSTYGTEPSLDKIHALRPFAISEDTSGTVQSADREKTSTPETPPQPDPWSLDFSLACTTATPRLRTWDNFAQTRAELNHASLYTSEQGEDVFNLLVNHLDPSIGMLPRDVVLRALCSLSLGRSSTFYQWNIERKVFEQVLKSATISGYSATCSDAVVTAALKQGTLLRRLREAIDESEELARSNAVSVALYRTLGRVLDEVESWIASRTSTTLSITQFEAMMQSSGQLIALCWSFHVAIPKYASSDQVMLEITAAVRSLDSTANVGSALGRAILHEITPAWTSAVLLEAAGAKAPVQRRGQRAHSTIMTDHDQELIHKITEQTYVMQSHDSDHPILRADALRIAAQVEMKRLDDIHDTVSKLQQDLQDSIATYRSQRHHTKAPSIDVTTQAQPSVSWSAFEAPWTDIDIIEQIAIDGTAATYDEREENEKTLEDIVHDSLGHKLGANDALSSMLETALDPATSIRPYIRLQAKLLDRSLLSLLFDHNLIEAMNVYKASFLLGSARFVQGLTKAFFDANDNQHTTTQRAHHRYTGLRLNTLNIPWPPSSSDLSLNLMGLLDGISDQSNTSARDTGSLSFAVREMSEADIARVCSPASVHALDFLRLQYVTSSPLDIMFTKATTTWYDEIFAVLLLHTRMLHLATTMRHHMLAQSTSMWRETIEVKTKAWCVHTLYHVISAIAAYAIEIAVAVPWQQFEKTIQKAERYSRWTDADQDEDSVSVQDLHDEHVEHVAHIRSGLFIGRRYESIRTKQNELYEYILHHGLPLQGEMEAEPLAVLAKTTHLMIRGLTDSLEQAIERCNTSVTTAAEIEVERMQQLLSAIRGAAVQPDV